MGKEIKFTRKDWELFRAEFRRWATQLTLHEWEILHVFKMPADTSEGVIGAVEADPEAMIATVYFTDRIKNCIELNGIPKNELIAKVAQHEAFELLLYKLGHLAQNREWNSDQYEMERHAVIHKLQPVVCLPEIK
jgi:hypothetical protein